MEKIQVYLRKEELDALREAAARAERSRNRTRGDPSGRAEAAGPVAIWDGKPKRTSVDHDSVYGEP
jgi:hypothetical protein